MKTIFRIIKIAIIFAIAAVIFFLLINKTFINETYQGDVMEGRGIPIPRFMYFLNEDDDLNATFVTPLSLSYLTEKKDNYLNSLEKCYGIYYYDKDNNITITKYSIKDNSYYRKVGLSYVYKNLCSDDYKLSDMWVYEFVELSTLLTADINNANMTKLVGAIYSAKRVDDPQITDYESTIKIKVNSSLNDEEYVLEFSDFSESELAVRKKASNVEQLAVYEVGDVVDFLNSLKN